MTERSKFFDDLAGVAGGAMSALAGLRDEAESTIRARVELANPSGLLAPGMFVMVAFSTPEAQPALLIPSAAVIQTGRRSLVMVAEGSGRFRPVEVEVGLDAGDQTEIRRGLAAGQNVVVSGQFLVDSEASLSATGIRMGAAPESPQPASAQEHHGEGRIESIGTEDITLSHGAIPSLKWPPMTMSFGLPVSGLPGNLRTGQVVRFSFAIDKDGAAVLTGIQPIATETRR